MNSEIDMYVPLMGNLHYLKHGENEWIRLEMADGSVVVVKPGRDGFFDDNFTELKKYATQMKRLLDFLEEKAKKDAK